MWDEVSRDSPFGKPTVTHRNVITPTGRSSTGHSKHSKTRMPNVMDVLTHISPCTNVVKPKVTTTELSPIRGIMQDDSDNEALVSPMSGTDYDLSACSTLLAEESDINDTVIVNSHNLTANSSICNYEKTKKKVGIRKTGDEICGPVAILKALSEGCQCEEADRCGWNSLNPATASNMMEQCRKYRVEKIPAKSTCEFLMKELTRGKVNVGNEVRFDMTCNSQPLCRRQWLHLYGFYAGSTTVKRALLKIKNACHSFAKQRCYAPSQTDVATLWCVAEIKSRMGDLSPKTGKHMIVKPRTVTWWMSFLYDEKHTSKVSISQQRFSVALNTAYKHQDFLSKVSGKSILEVREVGSMTLCDTCEDLQTQMGNAKTRSEFRHLKLEWRWTCRNKNRMCICR